MNRVSVLQGTYNNQRQSIIKPQVINENKFWHGKHGFCLIWMVIGILLGGIPLAAVLTLFIKQQQQLNYNNSTTAPIPTLRWKPDAITVAGSIYGSGNAANQLNRPLDVTLDYSNTLYIADYNNHRIQKYPKDATVGITVAGQNGAYGSTSYDLKLPSHILVDSNLNLYITDSGNHRIQLWENGVSFGKTIAGAGGVGNSSNQLNMPFGTARDLSTNTLYIADYLNHRIISYAFNAASGVLVVGGNGGGTNKTQLHTPVGIYFDSLTNSLVIVNHGTHNIVRWVLGTSSWILMAGDSNGLPGNTSNLLFKPTYTKFDPMGNMYVADRNNHRIQLFLNGQSDGITIAGTSGIRGNSSTQFDLPWAVELDNQLNLYVADSNNHRIQKFLRY